MISKLALLLLLAVSQDRPVTDEQLAQRRTEHQLADCRLENEQLLRAANQQIEKLQKEIVALKEAASPTVK